MSWEEQAYSFGIPNAQPPTPTRTPTSGVLSSPTFQTPRANGNTFDDHTGWTPTFAEEYSVFNATPGRLTNAGGPFDISTPRPSTASSQKGPPSTATDLEAELASHVHHTTQITLPLPPVDASHRLSSSPQDTSLHGTGSDNKKPLVTPRKPRRRLEEAFSGQTATPPQSAAKSSRKLAPKPEKETMQRDQEPLHSSSGTTGLRNLIPFSNGADNMYSYPMSAPATAPIFTNTKSFWDPDTSMSGMEMDMSFTSNDTLFDPNASHRISSSAGWGRSDQFFQGSDAMRLYDQNASQTSRSQHPIISAQNIAVSTFSFGPSTIAEDPFSVATCGAVDPGLLFAFPETASPNILGADGNNSAAEYSQPTIAHTVRQPYQHQQRESMRDQDELRKARLSKDKGIVARQDRASLSSPVKSARPGIQRSVSDSRAKIGPSRKLGQTANIVPRPSTSDVKSVSNRGRTSPVKHQNRMSLNSIPESVPGTRTSLTFSIDENGRARTETRIVFDEPAATTKRASTAISEDWDSPHSESSTDEDPIIVPSRSTSFSLPPRRVDGPRLARFDISRQPIEDSQRSFSSSSAFHSSRLSGELESEAETVVDDYDGTGDATNALRKAMESRKQNSQRPNSSQRHVYSTDSDRRRAAPQFTSRNSQQYYNSGSSTNLSPTTVSDPDLETPSTDRESSRSDSTRCICNTQDGGDGFMIQCESCEKWLHGKCIGISRHRLPNVYICAFCAQTPNMRGGRIREPARAAQPASSPLAHKSFKSWR